MTATDRDQLAALIRSAGPNVIVSRYWADETADRILASDWLAAHDAAVTARAHAPALALADEWERRRDAITYDSDWESGKAEALTQTIDDLRAALDPAAVTQHDTDIRHKVAQTSPAGEKTTDGVPEPLPSRSSVAAPPAGEPARCPTCDGPRRETIGMVCQTCGRDYGREWYAGRNRD